MPSPQESRIIRDTIIFPASLDPDAVKIVKRLKRFGHTAYLVGGCVRDLLLGMIPKDFDIATSARPRQIKRLFRNSKIIGRRFKLAHILFRGNKIIEVSTFRKIPDENSKHFQSDGLLILRDNVYGEPWNDAQRRDFTINALFYDLDERAVIDYTGGFSDLQEKRLKTIGDPVVRLREDPVRILRAVKFSCRLDLEIDPKLLIAMKEHVHELTKSAPPRVKEEIIRLVSCGASREAVQMLFDIGGIPVLLPEFSGVEARQDSYFGSDLAGKMLVEGLCGAMDGFDRGRRTCPDTLYLAMLLAHIVGATLVDTVDRQSDRTAVIEQTLKPITQRMGVSRKDHHRIVQIIHAFPRFDKRKWRGRPRPKDFVKRDYFPEALEFYRLVIEALGRERDSAEYWMNRWINRRKEQRKESGERRRRPQKKKKRRTPRNRG